VVTTAGLLVVAAFVPAVVAIILSFTWQWWALAPGNLRNQSPLQPDAALKGSQMFEAALAASEEAGRVRLARQERVRKILTPVAFGLSGLPLIFAPAALLVGDREAAIVCAMTGTIGLGFTTATYFSARRARKKATHSAPQVHQ
jgi:hypothetical protein